MRRQNERDWAQRMTLHFLLRLQQCHLLTGIIVCVLRRKIKKQQSVVLGTILLLSVGSCTVAANLRKLKTLKSFSPVAVSKDLTDSQNTGPKWVRYFISGNFEDITRQTAMAVNKIWTYKSEEAHHQHIKIKK